VAISPVASPYLDLRIYDKDAQDVFEAAIVNLQTYLPEWTPREGHTEVMLLETLALEVAEQIFAINRIPGAIMEILLRLYGVERDTGTPPTTTLLFTASDDVGHTIPTGTRAALTLGGDADPLTFTTTEPAVIAPGDFTGAAGAAPDTHTTPPHGTPAGTLLDLIDSVIFLERVELSSNVVGGAEAEDDQAWFTRGKLRLSRLVETLVLPRHFMAAALEDPLVTRAFAVDQYDPATGPAPGDNPGHITVAVYGDGGTLTGPQKTTLEGTLSAQAQANLAVHVVDPTLTTVDVTATLLAKEGADTAVVQAAAEEALAAYISPEGWPWTETVYRFELVSLLDQVEGVERVVSLTVPAADTALGGVAPLAILDTATITVTAS
jgi:uncharacterized phage protein gp47/JayE